MSSLMISTSGIRGIIGESLTPEVILNVAKAYGKLMGKGPVILGGDTRVSHEMVINLVKSGLTAVGTDVIHIGKVTTPTVQQMIRAFNAKGGVVITASHNPIQWNGIKLMNDQGAFLTTDQFATFKDYYDEDVNDLMEWDSLGQITEVDDALERHVDLICNTIDVSSIKNSNLNVLVDANNGTGALANPILLDRLGVNYKIINEKADGRFAHDPEPLKQNLSGIIEELKKGQYDIGFVQDADADRLVILDETGHFIGEDYSLALCIDYVLGYEDALLDNKQVVVNLSTSNVINYICEKNDAKIYHTRIGEPNVTAKLRDISATVGGEGNGGVIYPKIGWGRDSLVGIVLALKHLVDTKKKVSEIVETYPQYVMLRDKFKVSDRSEVSGFLNLVEKNYQQFDINKEDGVKVNFANSWLHVRPSNTEPIVRIFIEAPTIEEAEKIKDDVSKL